MLCNLWLPSEGFWWLLEVSQNVWVILVFVNLQKGSCELLPPSKYMYLRLPSVGMSVFHLTSDIFVVVWVSVSNLHWSYKITVLHVSPSEPSNFSKCIIIFLWKKLHSPVNMKRENALNQQKKNWPQAIRHDFICLLAM